MKRGFCPTNARIETKRGRPSLHVGHTQNACMSQSLRHFFTRLSLGASRQDHATEISHEALRVFDSRCDCCYPRSASPCTKSSNCEIERGFESQRVRADVERRSNSKM